jgi:hypothetical protein
MANDVEGITNELERVSEDVKRTFGGMSPEQLNWRPAVDSWSIAQCLDHLIKSNEEFYPELDSLAAGTRKNTLWQSWSPLSGIAGSFLVATLKKDGNKVKTNQKMTPPSDVASDIVDRFLRHQADFASKVRSTNGIEWRKVVLTSPFVKIMTYRMDVGLQALVEHEKRHLRQAKRVMDTEGFPK